MNATHHSEGGQRRSSKVPTIVLFHHQTNQRQEEPENEPGLAIQLHNNEDTKAGSLVVLAADANAVW